MASMLCASLCGKTFPRVSIASVYGEQLIWVNFANRLARKRLLHRLNLRSGVLPLFPPTFSLPKNKKRLIAGCPRLFCELSQRPRVYITCTAFLASLYILVFHACHLWPHSTCPLLDTPLVFHNHNLHLAPRSCCHSTNHCYELVIRYSFFCETSSFTLSTFVTCSTR